MNPSWLRAGSPVVVNTEVGALNEPPAGRVTSSARALPTSPFPRSVANITIALPLSSNSTFGPAALSEPGLRMAGAPKSPPGGRTEATTSKRPAGAVVCGWVHATIAVPSRAIATSGLNESTPVGDIALEVAEEAARGAVRRVDDQLAVDRLAPRPDRVAVRIDVDRRGIGVGTGGRERLRRAELEVGGVGGRSDDEQRDNERRRDRSKAHLRRSLAMPTRSRRNPGGARTPHS